MTTQADCNREDNSPVTSWDPPVVWHQGCTEDDHCSNDDDANDDRKPETAEDTRNFDEEVGSLDFLFRSTPRNVVGNAMRDESL